MFYYQQKTFDGTYRSCTASVIPPDRNPEGRKADVINVHEVPDFLQHLTIAQLDYVYGAEKLWTSKK